MEIPILKCNNQSPADHCKSSDESFDGTLSISEQNVDNVNSSASFINQPSLLKILNQIFLNKNINPADWNLLNDMEKILLKDSLKRKFDISESGAVELKKNQKRSEEECKFVTKRAFKFLLKAFKSRSPEMSKISKERCELMFYEAFFGCLVQDNFEELDRYFLPGSKLQLYSPRLRLLDKTVSYNYLQKICHSEAFRRSFEDYIINFFYHECIAIREDTLSEIATCILENRKVRA